MKRGIIISLGGSAGRERCKNTKLADGMVFLGTVSINAIVLENCGSKTWK